MRVHLIVDFQYNYYRAKGWGDIPEDKRLSCVVDGEEVDTTNIYGTLKMIESYRKQYLKNNDGTDNEVTVSIAADSKTVSRRDVDTEYKSNRGGRLQDDDFTAINRILNMLENIGYNVYRCEGYEADDIIRTLVLKHEKDFDLTIIHTNDSDILVNISDKVGVARFKSNLKYHLLTVPANFSAIMSKEFKCQMPYNCILLYKSTVGDKSDVVKGIKGFGPKAFDKIVDFLSMNYGDRYFRDMADPDKVESTLELLNTNGLIKDDQLDQALHSLELVKFKILDFDKLHTPVKNDSDESRKQEYTKYAMFSLAV